MEFHNSEAFMMCVWAYSENNRIKASKIYKVACQMEERYREANKPYLHNRHARSELGAKIIANKIVPPPIKHGGLKNEDN